MKKSITTLGIIVLFISLQGCGTLHGGARLVRLDNNTCKDKVSGLVWQTEKSASVSTLKEAEAYITKLNSEGEYNDWRLPTIYELYALNYVFDLHQNGDCTFDREGKYWSGEKDGEGMVGAWEIADQCDPERHYFPGGKGHVRAVRP